MSQYLQKRILSSKATFPVAVVFALLLWGQSISGMSLPMAGAFDAWAVDALPVWLYEGCNLLCLFLAVYLLIEINNAYSIAGHRSVWHVALFVVSWGSMPFVGHHISVNLIMLLMALAVYFLFACYQNEYSVVQSFLLFACLSIGSLLFPPMLYFVPLFYLFLLMFHALSLRSFFAAFLGALFPYWLLFVYAFYTDQMALFVAPWTALSLSWPVGYEMIPLSAWTSLALGMLLLVVGTVHLVRNGFLDKIRTRAFLYSLIFLAGCSLLFLLWQPHYYMFYIPFIQIGSCMMCSHFFSLVETKFSNIFFVAVVVIMFFISLFNLWMSLFNFS